MAKEILQDGKVIVCRPDAEDILNIRGGSWEYDQLIEWAEIQDKEIESIYKSGKSPLPKKPDLKKLDALCIKIVEEFLGEL